MGKNKEIEEFGKVIANFLEPINYEDEQVKIYGTRNNLRIKFVDNTISQKSLSDVVTSITKINDRFLYLEPFYFLDKKLGQLYSIRHFCYIYKNKIYLEHATINLETGDVEHTTNILAYDPDFKTRIIATNDFLLINDIFSKNILNNICRVEVINENSFLFFINSVSDTKTHIVLIQGNSIKITEVGECYPRFSFPFLVKGYPYTIMTNYSCCENFTEILVLNMKIGKVVGKYKIDTELSYGSKIIKQTRNKIIIQSGYNAIFLDLKTGKSDVVLASSNVFVKQGKLHVYKKNRFVEVSDITLERVNILGQNENLSYVLGANGRQRFLFIVNTVSGKCDVIKFKKGRKVGYYSKSYYVLEGFDGITRLIEIDRKEVVGFREFENGKIAVTKGACGQVTIEGPDLSIKGLTVSSRIFEKDYC